MDSALHPTEMSSNDVGVTQVPAHCNRGCSTYSSCIISSAGNVLFPEVDSFPLVEDGKADLETEHDRRRTR